MAPVFGYWSLRGLAEPIRYMLHHIGLEFEDCQYDLGSDPATCRDKWLAVKETLGLRFPNLPYYIDGSLKLTESQAILRYLGRHHGLAGDSEEDYQRIDVAMGVMQDLHAAFSRLCYDPKFDSLKDAFIAESGPRMEKFAKLLHGHYITGDKISFADFLLFELLERYSALMPSCMEAHPSLKEFHARMLALPGIAKYRQSASFQKIKTRFNGRMASFGGGEY